MAVDGGGLSEEKGSGPHGAVVQQAHAPDAPEDEVSIAQTRAAEPFVPLTPHIAPEPFVNADGAVVDDHAKAGVWSHVMQSWDAMCHWAAGHPPAAKQGISGDVGFHRLSPCTQALDPSPPTLQNTPTTAATLRGWRVVPALTAVQADGIGNRAMRAAGMQPADAPDHARAAARAPAADMAPSREVPDGFRSMCEGVARMAEKEGKISRHEEALAYEAIARGDARLLLAWRLSRHAADDSIFRDAISRLGGSGHTASEAGKPAAAAGAPSSNRMGSDAAPHDAALLEAWEEASREFRQLCHGYPRATVRVQRA